MKFIHFYSIILTICLLYNKAKSILKIKNKNMIRKHLSRSQLVSKQNINGEVSAYCFVSMNEAVYDLNPLYDPSEDYSIITADGKDTFYFNFCQFAVTQCKKDKSYVIRASDKPVNNKSNDCSLLSGTTRKNAPKWKITKADNSTNTPDKLTIKLPDGDRCYRGDLISYYSTTYEITCDPNVAKLAIDNPEKINPKSCHNTIMMRSKFACPNYTKYSLTNTIMDNSPIFGLILMAFGIYFCFLAYKYIYITRILTGVTIVCFVSLFLFANNLSVSFNSIAFWAILVMSIVIGLGLGWTIANYPWIVSAALGALLGFIFTEILYQLIASSLTWNPKGVYWIIFSLSVVIGIVLGVIFQKHVFVIACGFVGAYAIIRGFAVIENNFPNEQLIFDLIDNKEWPQLAASIDYRLYLYLFFSILLGCFGVCFQYRNYFKDIKEDTLSFTKM